MIYKKEFERLYDVAKQAVDSDFKSRAANGILKAAVEYYEEEMSDTQSLEQIIGRIKRDVPYKE